MLCAKQSEENTMLAKNWIVFGLMGTCGFATAIAPAAGARYADVPGYYEPGGNVDVVFGSSPLEFFDNAQAALGGPGEQVALSQGTLTEIVSLGGWTDDPLTGINSVTPGLVVGFSVEVLNGPGNDLLVVGNAPSAFTFYEPGLIEVAIESDGGGAKPNGWQDETFYLIKPGNFAQITDPRTATNDITVTSNPDFSLTYSTPFNDDTNLPGYFDITPGGDGFDIADAIDSVGNQVWLTSIAYVRLRSVSDSAFPFGSFITPEVDYLQVLEIEGDNDGNGFVDIIDLGAVLSNWNLPVPAGSRAQGDSNGDGLIDIIDLNAVLAHWNTGVPSASLAIPEPGTVSLWVMIASGAIHRRRSSREQR